jgi:hypothetical protein
MAQPLRVPMAQVARAHLQRRAEGALNQLACTLRRAVIRSRARVQFYGYGGRIVLYIQGPGVTEAALLVPLTIDGFEIQVV